MRRDTYSPTPDRPMVFLGVSDRMAEHIRPLLADGGSIELVHSGGHWSPLESYKHHDDGTPEEALMLMCWPCANLTGPQRAVGLCAQLTERGHEDTADEIMRVMQGWLDEDYPGRLDTTGIPVPARDEDEDD